MQLQVENAKVARKLEIVSEMWDELITPPAPAAAVSRAASFALLSVYLLINLSNRVFFWGGGES